ncbi:MAG: hypothetical protein KatS3mg088_569 [Patescibacteria group bacterium]|nr:MAG: hypothetical protein KatS3mg088_569 [Patescibacteria group bacterium]
MLTEKALSITRVVSSAASNAYPLELQRIVYRTEKIIFHNCSPENILDDLFRVLKQRPDICFTPLKAGFGISKAEILKFYAAFSDQHNQPFSQQFIERIGNIEILVSLLEEKARQAGRPLLLSEQLSLALDYLERDASLAVFKLSVATRAIARGFDKRITPDLKISRERIANWQNVVAALCLNQNLEDPAGDTYHFWNAVLLGISANERTGIYGRMTGQFVEITARLAPLAAEILRYRICGHPGQTHPEVDYVGYEVGKAIALLGLDSRDFSDFS